jgi:N-acetyl-anhydromuramyl-L-alanine amidase AmpD
MVSLQKRAWHAGRYNDRIGICLPGPWYENPRDLIQYNALQRLLTELQEAFVGTLDHWYRHSEIAPERRRDPGPGVDARWEQMINLII